MHCRVLRIKRQGWRKGREMFAFTGSVNWYFLSSNFEICINNHLKGTSFWPSNPFSWGFLQRNNQKSIQRCIKRLFKSDLKKKTKMNCVSTYWGFFRKLLYMNKKMLSCRQINDLCIQLIITEALPSARCCSRHWGYESCQ